MTMQGYVCSNCGYVMFNLDKPSEPPVYSVCPSCHERIDFAKSLIQDLYGVETVEAHEAARITVMDEERQRQGFETLTTYSMADDAPYARKDARICADDGLEAKLTYVPAATIWKINLGLRRRANPQELGFWINPYTGQWSKRDDDDGVEEPKDPDAAVKKEVRIVPFVRDTKNMLVFEPPSEIVESREAMSTFRAVTGEFASADRELVVNELAESEKRILVATDCLSEGINLQHGFDAVVHYDMVWNPTRHEQREGRVDRYGQPRPEVKCAMLYSHDNAVDGLVLNVIVRKAREIRKELGVSVPVPADDSRINAAILQAFLLKGRPDPQQLDFFDRLYDGVPELKAVDDIWSDAREREKKNRTIFAQKGLKPEDVAPELEKTTVALGTAADVARFVSYALAAEITSVFIHDSGRFTLSNEDDSNLYAVFTELVMHIRNPEGRVGLVVPAGICSDNSTQRLFAAMANGKTLEAVLSFENEEFLFPAVHHSYKFALLTLGKAETTDFTFFNRRVSTLADERRHFTLSAEDFALINPNTFTAPVFRTKADAELAKKIYTRVGVLWNEAIPNGNPWGVSFKTLFHMANDSARFLTAPGEVASATGESHQYLPLYEAKMIHQFDHRWASAILDDTVAELASLDDKRNPAFEVRPRYWVNRADVETQFDGEPPKYLMGWRKITNATNEITTVETVFPFAAAGDSLLLLSVKQPNNLQACLLADLCSIPHDWCARQKLSGMNFN